MTRNFLSIDLGSYGCLKLLRLMILLEVMMTPRARLNLIEKRLSDKELDIVTELCKGLLNKEIAKKLEVTEKTVKYHLTNVYKKLSLKSRMELIRYVVSNGGITSET